MAPKNITVEKTIQVTKSLRTPHKLSRMNNWTTDVDKSEEPRETETERERGRERGRERNRENENENENETEKEAETEGEGGKERERERGERSEGKEESLIALAKSSVRGGLYCGAFL